MCSATCDSERMSGNHSCPCESNYGGGIDPEVLTHYNWPFLQARHFRVG